MTRRTIITIGVALIAAAIIGTLWLVFFRSSTAPAEQSGTFGTGQERTPSTGTGQSSTATNIPNSVGQTTSSGSGNFVSGGNSTLISSGGTSAASSTDFSFNSQTNWLAGGGTNQGISGGSGTDFNPTPANELNNGQVGGTVSVLGTGGNIDQSGGGNNFLGTALVGAAVGTALCTAGLLSPTALGAGAVTASALTTATARGAVAVPVSDQGSYLLLSQQLGFNNTLKANDTFKADFLDCITRTIAKAALQQITASVVNWINSGFNGQPSFVQNYQQFFTNVADQAAGAYIQGSALSFLCSPFQLKVRIAIAQSYAQRSAQSCTLSGVINNIEAFANGNFSQGGWAGLLQFTTVPTNNPYGAFAYAQIGLATAQQTAVGLKQQDLTLGQGFLSFSQPTGCTTINDPQKGPQQFCTGSKIVTPGKVIESSLEGTENSSLQSLNLAKNFDEIISALITQLMTRTLYSGLGNLSGTTGYQGNFLTPDQQQAQDQGNQLLTALQSLVTLAQQYGQVEQGSIQDIENTQQQLSTLENCWLTAASSTVLTDQQRNIAANNATSADNTLHSFDAKIATYNTEITRANNAIAVLQDLQSRTLNVQSTADVTAITNDLNAAQAAGTLLSQNDITTAQQDRSALQTSLASTNSATSGQLTQCYAFVQ